MLNTVNRNDLFNQTTLSKCGRVLRRKGVLTCYLNGTMREGGRRSGADLRHRCTTCMQGKCFMLLVALFSVLLKPTRDASDFKVLQTSTIRDIFHLLSPTDSHGRSLATLHAHMLTDIFYLQTIDSIESKRGAFPVFQ